MLSFKNKIVTVVLKAFFMIAASISPISADPQIVANVSVSTPNENLNEGDIVTFRLTNVFGNVSGDLVVNISLSDPGRFIMLGEGESLPKTAVIENGKSTAELRFTIQSDNEFEANQKISIALLPSNDSSYTLGTASSSVMVYDNDAPDGFSLISVSDYPVVEGESVRFQVISNPPPSVTKNIQLKIEDGTGDFIDGNPISEIQFPANAHYQEFEVSTRDDSKMEDNGQISAEIIPTLDYNVAKNPNNSAKTMIMDNDSSVTVQISTQKSKILEGEIAKFRIAASVPTISNLLINIRVKEIAGDYLQKAKVQQHILIPKGSLESIFHLPTVNDMIEEEDGEISVEIIGGIGYSVADTPHDSVQILVLDDDHLPIFNIVSNSSWPEIIIAIFTVIVVPLTGFGVWWLTIWQDNKKRRIELVQTVLRTRSNPEGEVHKDALNLAQLEFIKSADICDAWEEYRKRVKHKNNNLVTKKARMKFEEKKEKSHEKLLYLLSMEVGIDITIDEIKIDNFIT